MEPGIKEFYTACTTGDYNYIQSLQFMNGWQFAHLKRYNLDVGATLALGAGKDDIVEFLRGLGARVGHKPSMEWYYEYEC